LAIRKKYKEAAKLISLMGEHFELRESDEFLLRHLFLIGMLGEQRDYMRHMFLNVYLKNIYFDKAEKFLMKTVAGVPDKVRKDVLQDRAIMRED